MSMRTPTRLVVIVLIATGMLSLLTPGTEKG